MDEKKSKNGAGSSSRRRGLPRKKRYFEQTVREVVDSLPEELKTRLENVAILIEEEPADGLEDSLEEGEDKEQELLGLYHGVSQKDRGFWYGNTLPDRIIIYRRPLERISSNLEDLRENIRQTVIHEIGHYFGFNEEDLRKLERGEG